MNRRRFVKNVALASPILLAPELLAGCNKLKIPKGSYSGKIIVIGAGAAGMVAAKLLTERNVDVLVLEAASVHGGRVLPLNDFASFPVELGAEEVHGHRTRWYQIVKDANADFINEPGENYYFLDSKVQIESKIRNDAESSKALDMVAAMDTYSGGEITAEQYSINNGVTAHVKFIDDAQVGGEFGTSMDRLSFSGVKTSNDLWSAGNNNYMIKNKSLLSVLDNYCSNMLSKIIYDTQVVSIDYSQPKIILTDQNGSTYEADKVIIAVPLTVLQQNSIAFTPALPATKISAINGIGIGAGMKIILKFNAAFWQNDLGSLYSDGVVPEYWPTALEKSTSDFLLTAFVMGSFAEYLSAQGSNAVTLCLTQLDAAYAGAATAHFTDSHIIDWSLQPFIGGAYSFPTQTSNQPRTDLAASVSDTLYFAGEATNTEGSFATVHGAVDSAFKVVEEILS